MFELTAEEFEVWRSQFVTSKSDKMGLRYKPMAFTEQGVSMLPSVLRSKRAAQVNIGEKKVSTASNLGHYARKISKNIRQSTHG
jgi:hypothetical protein